MATDHGYKAQTRALLAQGLSTEDIARQLGIPRSSVSAVKAHVTRGSYVADAIDADVSLGDEVEDARNLKFGLERDMQDALRRNISQLDPALRIVDDGRERHVESGFIDILAEDAQGLVAVELKSGEAPETAITQVLSYVGALQSEQAGPVRGILIAREFSTRVRLAARAAGVQLVSYGYEFTFSVVEPA